ncbi:MAG: hypothetical protein AAGE52_08845 [Myxococcota bacterium]
MEGGPLRPRVWPYLLLLVGGIGAGAWLLLQHGSRVDRVVVAAHGCSTACAENVSRRVVFLLNRHGFDASVATRDHDAIHVINVTIDGEERTPLVSGAHALRLTVRLAVESEGQSQYEGSVSLVRETHEADRARLEAGLAGVDALAPDAIAALVTSPPVERFLTDAVSPHTLQRFETLDQTRQDVRVRAEGARRFEELCDQVAREVNAPEPANVHCLTERCGNEYLVGVFPEGDRALLRVETAAPVFPVGNASNVQRSEVPERFVVAHIDGTRETVLETRNLFSSASLDETGRYVAYVEIAAGGEAVLVRFDLETGERQVVRAARPPARLFFPAISPGGEWVAVFHRPYRGGEERLYVMSADGASRWEPASYGVQARWLRWQNEVLLAVTVAGENTVRSEEPTEDRDPGIDESEIDEDLLDHLRPSGRPVDETLPPLTHVTLVRPTPRGGEVVTRIGGHERDVGTVAGVQDGALVATSISREHGCALARWDGEALTFVPLETCVSYPTLGRDGIYADAATIRDGDAATTDDEIVRVNLATGGLETLTANGLRDRWVATAPVGSQTRIFFERIPERRYARHPAAAVCWADVPPLDNTP